eukprot:SAG11_NODE_59_length_19156_cov_11.188750_13_plen_152_part_00
MQATIQELNAKADRIKVQSDIGKNQQMTIQKKVQRGLRKSHKEALERLEKKLATADKVRIQAARLRFRLEKGCERERELQSILTIKLRALAKSDALQKQQQLLQQQHDLQRLKDEAARKAERQQQFYGGQKLPRYYLKTFTDADMWENVKT